jgi:membrane complex biogenesis BtpA family protein
MTLIGMIHLLPLPAGPRFSPGFTEVSTRALQDAEALHQGGCDGLILENFGDAPFPATTVEPHISAFIAILASKIKERFPKLLLGVNLLRNDAHSALGVAAASGADFIRVNVHTGSMWTDQGLLQGMAHQTLRYRRELGAEHIKLAADILVKHAQPPGPLSPTTAAEEAFIRGGADILIISGTGTGKATDPEKARAVRKALPSAPLWVGSGVTLETAAGWKGLVDGAIVGTSLHQEGRIELPVDPMRVSALKAALS